MMSTCRTNGLNKVTKFNEVSYESKKHKRAVKTIVIKILGKNRYDTDMKKGVHAARLRLVCRLQDMDLDSEHESESTYSYYSEDL